MSKNKPMEYDGIFNNNLRFLIKRNDIMQKELAETIGIDAHTVNRYCRRNQSPRLSTAVLIADYFDVKTEDMLHAKLWEEGGQV